MLDKIKFRRKNFCHPSNPEYLAAIHWNIWINGVKNKYYIVWDRYARNYDNYSKEFYIADKNDGIWIYRNIDHSASTLYEAKRKLLDLIYGQNIF